MPARPHKDKTLSPRQAVEKVLRTLHNADHQALLAGGCVRDMLLGHRPKDYDVATDATPEAITKLFPRTLTVGAQFGVVVVLLADRQIEVATFRSDADYHDGRRPSVVHFTNAREDALRRDFTINGMFYDLLNEEVIDYVSGQADLDRGIIRAIGNPEDRFAEDHLRMLRAIRFASRLDFQIEKKTFQAIKKHAPKITDISSERIAMELEHILADPHRSRGLELAMESGLLPQIFTNLTATQIQTGIKTVGFLPTNCSFALVLATFLLSVSPTQAAKLCRQLKTSNDLRKQVVWLIEHSQKLLQAIPLTKGRLKQWLAQPLYESLIRLLHAHLQAQSLPLTPLRQLKKQFKDLGKEPISPRKILDGHDLIRLGATPGPTVGQLVEELYLAQLENHIKSKPQAEAWIKKWLEAHK